MVTAFDFSGEGNHASLNGPVRIQDVPSISEPYVTVTFNVDMDGVEVSEDEYLWLVLDHLVIVQ